MRLNGLQMMETVQLILFVNNCIFCYDFFREIKKDK